MGEFINSLDYMMLLKAFVVGGVLCIIAQILKDIDYQSMEQLPFKVVMKNGIYQNLSNYWDSNTSTNFYLGKIPTDFIQDDLDKIYKEK